MCPIIRKNVALAKPPMSRHLLAWCVLALVSGARSQTYPSSVLISSNSLSDVLMECVGMPPIRWRANGMDIDLNNIPDGIEISTKNLLEGNRSITITILKKNVFNFNGSSFQCSINRQNFSSVPTTFLIIFGNVASNN